MAGLNMSQALQNIGANLPNIFRQRQQDAIALQAQQAKQKKDEEEATQQAELSRIITELKKGELEQAQLASSMGAEGRKAVDEYTTSRNIRDLPISREYGQPLSDLERAEKYSLPKYAPYEPSAKSILGNIQKSEDEANGLLSGGAVWTQRTNAYKANPDAIPALGRQIEKLRSNGIIDEANYEQFKRTYEIDPATVDIAINKIVGNPLVAAATVSATTQPKVEQKRALIDPTAATTKANVIASNEGETESNQTAIPGFKPIQGVKITDDSVRKVKVAASQIEMMKSLADDLINKYNKMGSEFTGDDAADYSSKVRNLQLMAKGPEFYNLGVLTGPDLRLLEETIPNPASIREGVKKQVLGDISVKLNNFKNMLTQKGDQFYSLNGFEKEQPKKQKKVYNPQTGKFELR